MQSTSQQHVVESGAGDAGLSYTEAFPALPDKVPPIRPLSSPWPGRPAAGQGARMAVHTSSYSETVMIASEERRLREPVRLGSNVESEKSVCQEVWKETGAQITLTEGKDRTLTLLISGKRDDVRRARNLALQRLTTQANISLNIPKEHHRFLLGKGGSVKAEIEANSATRISVPKMDDPSDSIRITGPQDGIQQAKMRIMAISEEQSKRGSERMEFPKKYHPFILGPYNRTLEKLREGGVQVNIPPSSVVAHEVSFSGEKNAVAAVKKELLNILQQAQKTKDLKVDIPRGQHRYIQGPRNNHVFDILDKTGVWVELPAQNSDSNQVTLRGDPAALGNALNMVWNKANSVVKVEVKAPSFIHKHMIGRGGEKVKELASQYPEVHVGYETESDKIVVEGPPNDVEAVKKLLEAEVGNLVATLAVQELTINEKYMPHIIGKQGSSVSRLKTELGVNVRAGDEKRPNVIVVEGGKEQVAEAIRQLKERIGKMENERAKDMIIDRKLHKLLIGQKGERIRETRELFRETNVLFPDHEEQSDVVTIRGPKEEVDKCYKHLEKLVKELALSNHSIEVPIFKDMHRAIIGKGGATIRKIREETDTKIDLPEQDSESDVIVITGKKENAEKARKMIEKIQNEMVNAVEIKLSVPNKLHTHLIGAKGLKIQAVIQECGNVQITIPPTGSNSDEIVVRGPKEDAEKARDLLQKLAQDKELSSFTVEIPAKLEYHKYIRNRAAWLRERHNVRMIMPTNASENKENVTVIGRKEDVEKAQKEIEKVIVELQNTVDDSVSVPLKYHKRFTARRAEVIQLIEKSAGSVRITFPRNEESEVVTLRGPREAVEEAKKQLQQYVEDWESYVTVEVDIPPKAYGAVMGQRGMHVGQIQEEFDVHIKFPDRQPRPTNNNQSSNQVNGAPRDRSPQLNGHAENGLSENGEEQAHKEEVVVRPVVTVTGKPADCELAKEALLARVPVEEEMLVPLDLHRGLVRDQGGFLDHIFQKFGVSVSVPAPAKETEKVRLFGLRKDIEAAREAIQQDLDDLKLKSFKAEMRIDPKHHSLLIGPKGAKINEFRKKFGVDVQFPRRPVQKMADDQSNTDNNQNQVDSDRDLITLIGYEADVGKAQEHLTKFVEDLDSKVELPVRLDSRVHARIIGGKGLGLRKLCEKYHVDIRFPRRGDATEDPEMVLIVGDEENVYETETELKRLEDQYMEDVVESESLRQYHNPRPVQSQSSLENGARQNGSGFVVKGAPWENGSQQMPPNMEEFPTLAGMGTNGQAAGVSSGNSRWGQPR